MIRLAKLSEAGQVCNIVNSRNVSRDSGESGLVEYPERPVGWYKRALNGNINFYVAEEEDNVLGFCSAYTDQMLRNKMFTGDEIIKDILKNIGGPFLYIDQVALLKSEEGKGFGKILLETVILNSDLSKLVGACAHSPKRNEWSVGQFGRLGFILEREITVYDGLTFGIYCLNRFN
ncbi:MAG: GNAT family N-acetyltransferase [archaeon]|nr:GNAT family N-acetyltransferase [Nanoarchaeota archaeon]